MSNPQAQIDMSDAALMQRALDLAGRGATTTQPNPQVGCVLVKDGIIVGEGFHRAAGEPHAEREALAQAGELARGATAYVNLEPCCHQGRTPPCTDGLIDSGVKKVVAAILDPNPLVAGGGHEVLKLAGIEFEVGLLAEQAAWLNRGFVQRMKRQRPWTVLKSAATLDGRTAAYDGQSKWITAEPARAVVQQLRARSSAVVTGIETVLADDPHLNVRHKGATRQPMRVVLDSQLRLPLEARIIGADQNLLVFTRSEDLDKIAALIEMGVEVIQQSPSDQRLDLTQVLDELARWQCNEVLIEAGMTLSGAFVEAGLVDEMALFYAGTVLGDQGQSMFAFGNALEFDQRVALQVQAVNMVGDDVLLSAVNRESLAGLTA